MIGAPKTGGGAIGSGGVSVPDESDSVYDSSSSSSSSSPTNSADKYHQDQGGVAMTTGGKISAFLTAPCRIIT